MAWYIINTAGYGDDEKENEVRTSHLAFCLSCSARWTMGWSARPKGLIDVMFRCVQWGSVCRS